MSLNRSLLTASRCDLSLVICFLPALGDNRTDGIVRVQAQRAAKAAAEGLPSLAYHSGVPSGSEQEDRLWELRAAATRVATLKPAISSRRSTAGSPKAS